MSYLLEVMGRGWLGSISDAFRSRLRLQKLPPLADLTEAVRQEPERLDLRLQLGLGLLADRNPGKARQVIEEIVRLDGSDPLARIALACALDDIGREDDAMQQLRAAAELDRLDAAIWFALGYCHERRGDTDRAVEYYQQVLTISPGLRNARERLAAIALRADRIEDAVKQYETLVNLEPEHIDSQLTLANLYEQAGRAERAVDGYERALTLEPDNWEAHNDAIEAMEKAGKYHEAIAQLEKVAEKEPGFPDTFVKLGDLYAKAGDRDTALKEYMRALEIAPEYLEATVKIGTHHLRNGHYADAAAWFNRAVEVNDRLLVAYVGLGIAQHHAGRPTDAMATLDLAASIEPNSTLLFSEMARLQLKAAMQEECAAHLSVGTDADGENSASPSITDLIDRQIERHRENVNQHPNRADAHYRLGLLLRHQGRLEEAVAEFQEAVAINPVYLKALVKLGLALREMDQPDEAIRVLQRALEIQPEYIDLHYQLGCLFASRHRFELAVEHFDRCSQANMSSQEFRSNLALALEGMGLIDKATATWNNLVETAIEAEEAAAHRAK